MRINQLALALVLGIAIAAPAHEALSQRLAEYKLRLLQG
jgi:hypothetical protein